jgi:hypothetical protein
MKPKQLFFFFSICLCYYQVQGQGQKRANTDIKTLLSPMPLNYNQFLEFQGDTLAGLTNVIPEKSFNKDSLLKSSRDIYDLMTAVAGPKNIRDKYVGIAYKGKQTDKFNLIFWYRYGRLMPNAPARIVDTMFAPTNSIVQQLENLPGSMFVRHAKESDNWVIKFSTITNKMNEDSLDNAAEFDALVHVLSYVPNDYNLYKKIEVRYIDQSGSKKPVNYIMGINDLILKSLIQFIKANPKAASIKFK